MKAELAIMQDNENEAKSHFEMAISLSKENSLLSEQAIATERAAIFYLNRDSKQHGIKLLFQSYNCYKRWGAVSKQFHMAKRYPVIAHALKEAPNELDRYGQSYNSTIDSGMEEVSVMTDDLSSASRNTWSEQEKIIESLVLK